VGVSHVAGLTGAPRRMHMPVDFRTRSVSIPSGTGRRSINDSVTFGSPVVRAGIAVNGYKLDYVNADHHINVVEIDTDVIGFTGNTVNFRVECDYSDKNFDDPYRGEVVALVIAEVQ
jgi:hypothetical protein